MSPLVHSQIVEERVSGVTKAQYVWSPVYINALVERDRDADNSTSTGTGGMEQRIYAIQDANYNTTALVNTSGTVVERFQYDPYGHVTVLNADWTTNAATAGNDTYKWTTLFQGMRYDPRVDLTFSLTRAYSAELGRWISQDWAGYIDGVNMYQMVGSSPGMGLDPWGYGTNDADMSMSILGPAPADAFPIDIGTIIDPSISALSPTYTPIYLGPDPYAQMEAENFAHVMNGDVYVPEFATWATVSHPGYGYDRSRIAQAGDILVGIPVGIHDLILYGVGTSVDFASYKIYNERTSTSYGYYADWDRYGKAGANVLGAVNIANAVLLGRGASGLLERPGSVGLSCAARNSASDAAAVPKYASEVQAGDYLAAKAPMQVKPGIRVLRGQYIESTGDAPRVQPWTAHYDEYGRMIARTDYNAENAAAGIPDTHYATYGYNNGVPYPIENHVPGEYQP